MRLQGGKKEGKVKSIYLSRSPLRDPETILSFSKDCVNNVVDAYVPIVKKHMNDAFTPEQKQWQQVRITTPDHTVTVAQRDDAMVWGGPVNFRHWP